MFLSIVIGNLGGDAQCKEQNGRKFTTFRVAHNDSWTSEDGQRHDRVAWIDCILNDHPKVAEFLKAGTTVFVIGNASTRIYSSEKDRCMKAGVTINVQRIELIGGKRDAVPTQLFDTDGVMHTVTKFFHTDYAGQMFSKSNEPFIADANGWVIPQQPLPQQAEQQTAETTQQ